MATVSAKVDAMKAFIIRWLCTTLAVAVAAWLLGIPYTPTSLFVVALLTRGFWPVPVGAAR